MKSLYRGNYKTLQKDTEQTVTPYGHKVETS